MAFGPETRESLILRLKDAENEAAWHEFLAIYRPVVFRLALTRGLQEVDADDVTQEVMLSVSRKVVEWEADPARAKFRTWLDRVVRNAAINALTRRQQDRGVGGTSALRLINGKEASKCSDDEVFSQEILREKFRLAADEVERHFDPATWRAFWLTAVEGAEVATAAEETGKSIGAVYVARSRVMKRLRKQVKLMTGDESGGST